MTETAVEAQMQPAAKPVINTITLDEPWQWLAAGWKDLRHSPKYSLAYGLVFVLVSYLLTLALINGQMFFIIPPLAAGFFLLAPLLGIGLYAISRAIERNQPVELSQVRKAWEFNPVHISAMGLVLLMLMLSWMLVANLVFALFFNQPVPTWENFIADVFLSGDHPLFLAAGLASGGLIALFTFTVSAVSVPMLIDRQVDVATAIHSSYLAVRQNWRPLLLWACLIAMFVGVGILTFYLGLLVTMPLVGHATWHAYRDLIAE